MFLFVQLFLRLDCQVAFLFCLKSVTIIIYILKKMIPARARHKTILLPVVALAQAGSRLEAGLLIQLAEIFLCCQHD